MRCQRHHWWRGVGSYCLRHGGECHWTRFLLSSHSGDVELVQLGCAVVVASFLPYTQFRQANIIVDFFTANASQATQTKLDAFGTLLYTIVLGLIAWRVAIGCIDIKSSQETSMLMALPLWIPYMLMVPGLALCSVIGFVQTLQHLGLMTKENV